MLNSYTQGRFQGTLKTKMEPKIAERKFQLPRATGETELSVGILATYGNCLLEQNSTPTLTSFAQ